MLEKCFFADYLKVNQQFYTFTQQQMIVLLLCNFSILLASQIVCQLRFIQPLLNGDFIYQTKLMYLWK